MNGRFDLVKTLSEVVGKGVLRIGLVWDLPA